MQIKVKSRHSKGWCYLVLLINVIESLLKVQLSPHFSVCTFLRNTFVNWKRTIEGIAEVVWMDLEYFTHHLLFSILQFVVVVVASKGFKMSHNSDFCFKTLSVQFLQIEPIKGAYLFHSNNLKSLKRNQFSANA